jgi:membrane fusion protein (multidrug efflux system)
MSNAAVLPALRTSTSSTGDRIDVIDRDVPPARSETPAPSPKPARKKAPLVFGGLVVVAAAIALYVFVAGRGKVSTDDAQVEGHVATVQARVPGQVKRVLVTDNQAVKAGEVLVELDDADLAARLAAAQADLAAATAGLHSAETQAALTQKQVDANIAIARGGVAQAASVSGSTQAMIAQAAADVDAAVSRQQLAQTEVGRTQRLFAAGATTQSELDTRRAAADQADAAVAQARARLASAQAGRANSSGTIEAARGRLLAAQTAPEQVEVAAAQVELAQARVAQATAAVHAAELNLSYTKIRAELDGVVAKRTVEPGQMVSPERPLLALVGPSDLWVVANFKETQLADLRPGQRVTISVDTYDGTPLNGTVDSIQVGTGARFSLLPPDNASGNFTKVTQRVPVRIKLGDRQGLTLRPGMSTSVTIYTAPTT